MDCLVQLATALCLISPSQLTLRADVSSQVSGDVTHWSGARNYGGALLGHVGLELPLLTARHFTINAGYTHESLLNTRGDRGEERLSVGFVYRPFVRGGAL